MTARILYVAVNYETAALCERFVAQFSNPGARAWNASLVVVDNSSMPSQERLVEKAKRWPEDVQLLVAPANLGYFGAVRYALTQPSVKRLLGESDWMVVSNVDLLFDREQLERSTARHTPATTAVIAPRILSLADGSEQNPYMRKRPTTLRIHAYRMIFRSYWALLAYSWGAQAWRSVRRRLGRSGGAPSGQQLIYAPHGSFMILSSSCFARAEDFAFQPFLFGEEIFIAEAAARAGLAVVFDPAILVMHEDHAGMQSLPRREIQRFHLESAEWIARTYFSGVQRGVGK